MDQILSRLLTAERQVLLEHELFGLFESAGLAVPRHRFVPIAALGSEGKLGGRDEGARSSSLPLGLGELAGRRGVLKIVSEQILHKSDLGCVAFLDDVKDETVRAAAARMLDGLPSELRASVTGVLVEQAVRFEPGLGGELLLGLRQSPEFGPVATLGFGGTYVEALAEATKEGESTILFDPEQTTADTLRAKLEPSLFFRWISGNVRGVKALASAEAHHAALARWVEALGKLRVAVERAGRTVLELECNPLVWDRDRGTWVPVDALLRLGPAPTAPRRFDVARLRRGLHAKRVAIMGASASQMNVGRIILRCLLDHGFPRDRLFAIRDDVSELDGASCVPSVGALPYPVDLLVVAVGAPAVPALLEETIASGKLAGSVLLIPGGMGETEGGKGIEQQVLAALERAPAGARPPLIGNNSLGIVSKPDKLDSLFIPREKLPRIEGGVGRVAFISQSGAFMITAMTKLDFSSPDYQISLGNQIDARISDFVEALADEPALHTYALYVEGLKPGDGRQLVAQTRALVAKGREVIVYKAGRSPLGRTATMGHTASVAGDYRVFAELLREAGALVADSFSDFVDLVRLSATLGDRRLGGRRIAMTSNAGYEAVGLADNYRSAGSALEAATLGPETVARIGKALADARIAGLVTVSNPLDLTPMASDVVHEACMRALLDDPGVDLAVFGMVPLTAMVQSLPHGASERDVFDAPKGFANRTIALFRESTKPFVVVVDGGRLYDAMADYLQRAGVPVFRSGDRAIRIFGRYVTRRTRVPCA